jgi:membrane protein required for colicin V production
MNPFDMLIITILLRVDSRHFQRIGQGDFLNCRCSGGFLCRLFLLSLVARLISRWISNPAYLNIVSYMAVFSVVVIIVGILAVVIKYLLNIAYLGWVDRVSGALFGLLKGGLVSCVVFIVLTAFYPQGRQ